MVDVSAIVDADTLHVFAANRSPDTPAPVHITVADRTIVAVGASHIIGGEHAKAENTYEDQTVVAAARFDAVGAVDGSATGTLPPLSVATMTFELS
jgi:alpha-L-arabinofuranosidase